MKRFLRNCIEFNAAIGTLFVYILTLGVFSLYLNTYNPKLCLRLPGLFDAIRYRKLDQIVTFILVYLVHIVIIWLCLFLYYLFQSWP